MDDVSEFLPWFQKTMREEKAGRYMLLWGEQFWPSYLKETALDRFGPTGIFRGKAMHLIHVTLPSRSSETPAFQLLSDFHCQIQNLSGIEGQLDDNRFCRNAERVSVNVLVDHLFITYLHGLAYSFDWQGVKDVLYLPESPPR